jgi:hypothetical protein
MMPVPSFRGCAVVAVVALAVLSCDRDLSQPSGFVDVVPVGTWGGDSAGMIVGDSSVHFHVACTFGDVSGRIAVNAAGGFNVVGSYMLRAFPIAVGPTLPARFVGQIDGNTVTTTVIVDDTVQKRTVIRGPVRVTLGVDPRLGPCPICTRDDGKSGSMRTGKVGAVISANAATRDANSLFSTPWPLARAPRRMSPGSPWSGL